MAPWHRGAPHRLLVRWAQARAVTAGQRAVVVGCGLGDDAEYVAGLGFRTVAFDVADWAVAAARRRFPESEVEYVAADLLALPPRWRQGFDLVVESLTVQSLPRALRPEASAAVGGLVAPGGQLVVIASGLDPDDDPDSGPPWPLTSAEIEAFAAGGLQAVSVQDVREPDVPGSCRWLAEFRRPTA